MASSKDYFSPIAEMHEGLMKNLPKEGSKLFDDDDNNVIDEHNSGDESRVLVLSFKSALNQLRGYLAPPWTRDGTKSSAEESLDEEEGGIGDNDDSLCGNSIREVSAYVSSVVTAYESAAAGLSASSSSSSSAGSAAFLRSIHKINEELFDITEGIVVRNHAQANVSHCKALLEWLKHERWPWLKESMKREDLPPNFPSVLSSFVQEYFDWAPGPWRDVVMLEFLVTTVLPPIMRVFTEKEKGTGQRSKEIDERIWSSSTETGAMSISDEASDLLSVLSANGTRRKAHAATAVKKAAVVIQKLKTDVAVLKEALDKSNMTDIGMLEDKLRRSSNETTKLKSLGNEMRSRIQLLEEELYHLRTNLSTGATRAKDKLIKPIADSAAVGAAIRKADETPQIEISPRKNLSVREGIRMFDPKNTTGATRRSPTRLGSSREDDDEAEFSDAMGFDELPGKRSSTIARVWSTFRAANAGYESDTAWSRGATRRTATGAGTSAGAGTGTHPLLREKVKALADVEAANARLERALAASEERRKCLQQILDNLQSSHPSQPSHPSQSTQSLRSGSTDVSVQLVGPRAADDAGDFIPVSTGESTHPGMPPSIPPPVPPPTPPTSPPPSSGLPPTITPTIATTVAKTTKHEKRVNFSDEVDDPSGLEGLVKRAVSEIMSALPAPALVDPAHGASPLRASAVASIPMPRPRRGLPKGDVSAAVGAAVGQAVRETKKADEKMIAELAAQVKRLTALLPADVRAALASEGDDDGSPTPGFGSGQVSDAGKLLEGVYFSEMEGVARVVRDRVVQWAVLAQVDREQRAGWESAAIAALSNQSMSSSVMGMSTETPTLRNTASSTATSIPATGTQLNTTQPSNDAGFTVTHLFLSFFCGLLLMLCAVAITHWTVLTYFASQLVK